VYTFTTTVAGNLQIDISDCASSLAGWVHYNLINVSTSDSVSQGWSCWSQMINSLPAGDYRLVINNGGRTGTYHLAAGLQPAAQSFVLSLPKTVSDGDPQSGAGNLETTSSEDDYTFATTVKTTVQLDLSECASSLGNLVYYKLTDTGDDHQVASNTLSCGYGAQLRDIPAGNYKLAIEAFGHKGSYQLQVDAVAPQTFASALPIEVSDGVPSAGAGNLETGASEDVYTFTTTATHNVQIDISDCASSLAGWVHYNLINVSTSDSVGQGWSCWSQTINDLPAGDYRLVINNGGRTGTYHLAAGLQP
jgi:hypothetical protein